MTRSLVFRRTHITAARLLRSFHRMRMLALSDSGVQGEYYQISGTENVRQRFGQKEKSLSRCNGEGNALYRKSVNRYATGFGWGH